MKLYKIQIENFRSIKNEQIIFNQNCLILLGKNEAGKSNILKAIAAVFGKYTVSNKDKRKRIGIEKIVGSHVRAIFKLDQNDIEEIVKRFHKNYSDASLITFQNNKTLHEYVKTVFGDVIVQINIADNTKSYISYWTYTKKDFELTSTLFLLANQLKQIQDPNALPFNLSDSISKIVKEFYAEQKFNCHYWQYNDGFLLPNSVNRESFISNPSSVKGLENLFILSEREHIAKEFDEAMAQDGDYSNLLDQISDNVTKIFQKVWKDFKDTSIQLLSDGEDIKIKVVNKTKYSFEDRSDGFKKYISILLMLSTESRSNRINEKDLILIDEPDQSLYPTSASYLKEELLEISKKSKIVYSTHSQYMIDSNCIDRHLVIEKHDDITTIKKVDENSPFSNDELLRRAIGTSIFECIQSSNIIFEGWLDKELFNKFCEFKKKKALNNIGTVYLKGISGAEVLVQILILAKKRFIIVADSDETSKSKRKDFEKTYPEYKDNWLGYSDVNDTVVTMEDYFEKEYLKKELQNFGFVEYDESKSAIQNISNAAKNDNDQKQIIKNSLINCKYP